MRDASRRSTPTPILGCEWRRRKSCQCAPPALHAAPNSGEKEFANVSFIVASTLRFVRKKLSSPPPWMPTPQNWGRRFSAGRAP